MRSELTTLIIMNDKDIQKINSFFIDAELKECDAYCVKINRLLNHHYKPFKAKQEVDFDALRKTVINFLFAIFKLCAKHGASIADVKQAIKIKIEYNERRTDHVNNYE